MGSQHSEGPILATSTGFLLVALDKTCHPVPRSRGMGSVLAVYGRGLALWTPV